MKKSLYGIILMALFLSQAGLSKNENFIFIGNPGVGKSTIINSIIGKSVAKSGLSFGGGLTKFFFRYEHEENTFIDTPGLDDIELRKKAAKEIEKSLKNDGHYRIFFVIRLFEGRVMPADIATINTVMDAVKIDKPDFNVIINKLSPEEKEELNDDKANVAKVYKSINSGKHKTDSIHYVDEVKGLKKSTDKLLVISEDFRKFVFKSSLMIDIKSKDIGEVEIDKYEKKTMELEKTMIKLQEEIKESREKYDDLYKKQKKGMLYWTAVAGLPGFIYSLFE